MTEDEQKRYLIRFLRAAMRQLMIYRTFAEMAKQKAGPQARKQVQSVLKDIEAEPSLATQLGPDFETFLGEILTGPERDADQALERFLTTWTPNLRPN
jgi:hypothetical protein